VTKVPLRDGKPCVKDKIFPERSERVVLEMHIGDLDEVFDKVRLGVMYNPNELVDSLKSVYSSVAILHRAPLLPCCV
jgi:hypothetical protein